MTDVLKRENCWMSFSEALAQYLQARRELEHCGQGSKSWWLAKERLDSASEHIDALTDSTHLRSS